MAKEKTFALPKNEILRNEKQISYIYKSALLVKAFPIFFAYNLVDISIVSCSKVLFSVSKKKYKRAVDRNRIKRMMREAYRLNKLNIAESLPKNTSFIGVFNFVSKEHLEMSAFEKAMLKIETELKRNSIT